MRHENSLYGQEVDDDDVVDGAATGGRIAAA